MPSTDLSGLPMSPTDPIDPLAPDAVAELSVKLPAPLDDQVSPRAPAPAVGASVEPDSPPLDKEVPQPEAPAGLPPLHSRARLNRSLPTGASELAKRASPNSLAYTLAINELQRGNQLTVLRMMKSGLLKDFDERGPGGLTLLGQLSTRADNKIIPSWDEWSSDPKLAWAACLTADAGWFSTDNVGDAAARAGSSSNTLAAALIFAGADPWISWNRQPVEPTGATQFFPVASHVHADNMLSSAVDMANQPLARLLLSHPACPDAVAIDNMRVFHVTLPYPGRNGGHHGYGGESAKLPDEPFLHLLVAWDNLPMVKLFLEKGCDVNALNSFERSPLFYAHTPDMVNTLIAGGASVDIVDSEGKTADAFWNEYMNTTAARSSVMRALIDYMATIKTPQELIEHQKPALFATVLAGTKTDFETIYRKSKFSPSVLWDRGARGSWSLLTSALVRRDEKTRLFLNFLSSGNHTAPTDHDVLPGAGDRHLAVMTGAEKMFVDAGAFVPIPSHHRPGVIEPVFLQAFMETLAAAPALAGTGLDRSAATQFVIACLSCANLDGSGEALAKSPSTVMYHLINPDGTWAKSEPAYDSADRTVQALCAGSFPSDPRMANAFRKILRSLSSPEWALERDALLDCAGQTFLGALIAAAQKSKRSGKIAVIDNTKDRYFSSRGEASLSTLRKLEAAMGRHPSPHYARNLPLIALGYASFTGSFTEASVGDLEKKALELLRQIPQDALDLKSATALNEFWAGAARSNSNAAIHGEFFGVGSALCERVLLASVSSADAVSEVTSSAPAPARRRM